MDLKVVEDSSTTPAELFIEGELQRGAQFIEGAQKLGEESRKQLAARALSDLKSVRDQVVRLLELTETQAREDAEKARGEQAEQRQAASRGGERGNTDYRRLHKVSQRTREDARADYNLF